ncbi:hypothetical protein AB6A40_001786 [Gnathostoma spinigerum]|uniref:Kinesin-like protein n=1 Tax=Gnathostoma spinigerum TaxID=75299 RepID=A0ABD6EEH0_9BILA
MATRKRAGTPSRRGGKRVVEDKDAVEVVCRLCPLEKGDEGCAFAMDEEHVKLIPPSVAVQRNGQSCQQSIFKFTYVFDEGDSQRMVFERTSVDLIQNLLRGKNSLLFTYGVTGSGKTYTMTGSTAEHNTGILPRTLDTVFNSIPNRADKCVFSPDGRNGFDVRSELEAAIARRRLPPEGESIEMANRYVEPKRVSGASDDMVYAVFVSYIEVYNDVCYDLLDDSVYGREGGRFVGRDLRLGMNNVVYVDGVTEVEVESSDEALEQFFRGQERRRVADTLLNKQSSRSHSVFNIRLVMAPCLPDSLYPVPDSSSVTVSQLSLVDLAGSERTKRTGNEGCRLVETGKINQSLLVLRQCIEKLRENQKNTSAPLPVPYRESKITHLFKNYFEGTGKVRMIICINPRSSDYAENLQVLQFAEVAQTVEVAQGSEISMPVSDGLPISRKDFIKWRNEIETLIKKPISPYPSVAPPSFEAKRPEELGILLANLRSYYQSEFQRRNEITEEYRAKANDTNLLYRMLCLADLQSSRIVEIEHERDEAERSLGTLTAKLKQSMREVQSLKRRIRRYEAAENASVSKDEEYQRRERDYQEQLRRKQKALHQVREILQDTPSNVFAKSSENISKASQTVTSDEASVQPAYKSVLKNTTTSSSASSAFYGQAGRADNYRTRQPTIAPKPGFYNARYHRRSKSATGRIIDHQPRNRIPEGTVLQACFPRNKISTTQVEASDLQKSAEYMLTHQEVDNAGNLSMHLVKGECIPTAGGGTAVRFNDVECLSHETP